jgi:hypothetical protein
MSPQYIQAAIIGAILVSVLLIVIRFKTDPVSSLIGVLVAAAALWLVIHLLSPVGRSIPIGYVLLMVFLMEQCSRVTSVFLKRFFGAWNTVATIAIHMLIVFAFWRLNLWRTLVTVIAYWFIIIFVAVIADVAKRFKSAGHR